MTRKPIRVRFAPSPTGPLHLGGIRTALYNFLFARKNGGAFILRIEDTDRNRFVPGAEAYIMESLRWCCLEPDEGPERGGGFAPYRQSERSAIYRKYIDDLIGLGHAYYAFDTPGELDTAREKCQEAGKEAFQYDTRSRKSMVNSLTLSKTEVQRRIDGNEPYVVRMLIPENQTVRFHDLIRGEVIVHTGNIDDKVLFKSDGLPTYHLANVVDDYLMKISHVIRGEEWLPSAPMHLLLYRSFGWEEAMPAFAHLPLILKPGGQGKLSKRDGDRLGFPVFPIQWKDPVSGEISRGFREEGYLPDAFVNMLALLGWNPGSEKEIFSPDELVSLFSLERIQKGGSRFDPEKARWFNHQYMLSIPEEILADKLVGILTAVKPPVSDLLKTRESGSLQIPKYSAEPVHGLSDPIYARRVVTLIRDRVTLIPDLMVHAMPFYYAPVCYDLQVQEKVWKPGTGSMMAQFLAGVSSMDSWTGASLHHFIQEFTNLNNLKMGQLMMPLRLLVVGSNQGPGLTDIAELIGKEDFLTRLTFGIQNMP